MFYPQKTASIARVSNFSFWFCSLRVSHAWKSLKATFHSPIIWACVSEIEDIDDVLPVKDGTQRPPWHLFLWILLILRCPCMEIVKGKVALIALKATVHLTISMRGQRAMSKIQRNNYHYGSCGPSLTGKRRRCLWSSRTGHIGMSKIVDWEVAFKATFHPDVWHSDASLAWRSKTPTMFYPLQKGRNSQDGNYSFEFCPLHAAHT